MPYRIRLATPADAPQLLTIYAPYVTDTCISFETEVPTLADFEERIKRGLARFAYIVAEDVDGQEPVGYAYNGTYRVRPAYDWSSETSIYLAPAHQERGLGSALLQTLEELMRLQGIRMSEACITSSNASSIAFHERHGYRTCGEQRSCGYKLGQWLSVTWMEKQLLPLSEHPERPHGVTAAEAAPVLAAVNERLAQR